MFDYNILEKPDIELNTKTIDKIFKIMSNLVDKTQKWTLNIVFVDSYSIKKLNNDYRKVNKITDVLSFHYFEDFNKLKKEDVAWEIILNYDKIVEQAKEYKYAKEDEFYKLLIHSILHIIWYDHETEYDYTIMSAFEKVIWKKVFEK